MFCKNCGKKIDESTKFCSYCGKKTDSESKNSDTLKTCPFCKTRIGAESNECPNCHRILIEQTQTSNYKEKVYEAKEFHYHRKPNLLQKIDDFISNINFRRLIFNKFTTILIIVILVAWASYRDDSSYNDSGAKIPLPLPIQQPSDYIPELNLNTPPTSLTNGTILKRNIVYLQDYGELTIRNGTNLDAVAKLIRGGTSILTVYIKANNTYTMTDISDGIYWLVFTQGIDWDSVTQKFLHNTQYSAFEDTLNFTTTEDGQYYYYPQFEVTLNPVVGGTAETNNIPGDQFDKY